MRILLLSDGIPGHVNQAKGLILHLTNSDSANNIHVDEKIIPMKYKWMRFILRYLLNKHHDLADYFVNISYHLKPIKKTYDLIISAGGNTSFLNAQIAKKINIPNVFLGSLRGLKPTLFTVIMTLEAIGAENNIIMPFAPCLTTFESTSKAAGAYFGKANDDNTWLMIIGGNGARCEYDKCDWTFLADAMKKLSTKHNIKWLLTTSRRTGLENEEILKSLISENILEEAVWYNHQPEKVMQAYLGRASQVFCTVDSMSMLTEAISSCSRTTALIPARHQMTERYRDALSRFESRGLLSLTSINQLECYSELNSKNFIQKDHAIHSKVEQCYEQLRSELEERLKL